MKLEYNIQPFGVSISSPRKEKFSGIIPHRTIPCKFTSMKRRKELISSTTPPNKPFSPIGHMSLTDSLGGQHSQLCQQLILYCFIFITYLFHKRSCGRHKSNQPKTGTQLEERNLAKLLLWDIQPKPVANAPTIQAHKVEANVTLISFL